MSLTTARGFDYRVRLGAGPATFGDATAGLGLSKSAISKHVKVLGETGGLTRALEGRTHVVSPGLDVLREVARVDGSPAGRLGPLHRRRRGVPEGGRSKVNTPPVASPEERIYRTYFIDSRGDEAMGTTWSYLDMAPLGRQEDWEDSPENYPQLFELTKA